MTVYTQISQNNWPSSKNQYDDYLLLNCPLNQSIGLNDTSDLVGTIRIRPDKTLTVENSVFIVSTQSKYYGSSAYFVANAQPGNGGRLVVNNISQFSVSSSESWCFEAWIYPTQVTDATIFGVANNGFGYRIISGSPYLYVGGSGGILNTGTITANTWQHVAVSRDVNSLRSFINGTQVGSTTSNSSSWDATSGTGAGVFIGAANLTAVSPPNYHFNGYMNDCRFYKGTAKYTANFTPPGPILGSA